MRKIPWGFVAAFIFMAMIWTLIPGKEIRNRLAIEKRNLKPEDTISIQAAEEELGQIKQEIDANWGKYDGTMAYRHMKRLFYIENHLPSLPNEGRDLRLERLLWNLQRTKGSSAVARRDQQDYQQVARDFIKLRDSEPNSLNYFEPVTVTYNFRPVLGYWVQVYRYTTALAFLFFICLLMRGEILLPELKRFFVFRLAVFSAVWPVAIWFYPSKDFVYRVQEGLGWLNWVLSLAISMVIPGLAKAQQDKIRESGAGQNHSLSIGKPPTSDLPRPRTTYGIEFFSDTGANHNQGDQQLWLKVNSGAWRILVQNRRTLDGKTALISVMFGRNVNFGNRASITAIAGPQYTDEAGKINRMTLFIIGKLKIRDNFSLLLSNRFSWKLPWVDKNAPFVDRHVQVISGIPKFPSWISFETEEFRTPKGMQELFVGPSVSMSRLLKRKGRLWKGSSLYPYYDFPGKRFELRTDFSYSF